MRSRRAIAKLSAPYVAGAAAAAIALAVLAVVAFQLPPDRREDLALEAAKAAIQVLPLAFFSVVVADLIRRRDERRTEQRLLEDRQRELDRRRDEFRRRFLSDVVVAYNHAKGTRRKLRGAGLGTARDGKLRDDQIEQLDTYLAGLNETQLDVETLKREVAANRHVFTNHVAVEDALGKLESYLNDVIKDWERGRPKLDRGDGIDVLTRWPNLRRFVASKDDDGNFHEASDPMHAIEDAIWPDLLRAPDATILDQQPPS